MTLAISRASLKLTKAWLAGMAMIQLKTVLISGAGFLLLATLEPGMAQNPAGQPTPNISEEETVPPDEMSLGEVPPAQTVELTVDLAKKAVDAFVLVRDKYADTTIYQYETLEEFVEKTDDGKTFDADIKSFGFASVGEWNVAISTVGLTYTAVSDGPDYDVASQIEEIKADKTIAKDMKDRMIASLSSLIPSENNKKVITELMKEENYREKLKLLAEEE
jgi:hypothetical protein